MSHYIYVVAFLCIVVGLLWGRFKAMHVFGFTVLALLLSGFMGIKHIYSAAVNPSLLTVMALIALTGVLKKQIRIDLLLSRLGNSERSFPLLNLSIHCPAKWLGQQHSYCSTTDSKHQTALHFKRVECETLLTSYIFCRRCWWYYHLDWHLNQPCSKRYDDRERDRRI